MPLLYDFNMDTAEDLAQRLAENVKRRRLEKGLSRSALSMMSGVPVPTIAKFEQHHNISLMGFLSLAKALGYTDALKSLLADGINLSLVDAASGLINTVSGVEAIKRVQDEAQQIFAKYSDMTGAYSDACNTIRELVSDFSEVRQSTCEAYKKYALLLIDLFGDSIKATMPELFDFDSVQFLDVESMHQNVKLAYDGIYGKCGALIGDVSDSFTKALSRSASRRFMTAPI